VLRLTKISIVADIQVNLKLPVLRQGSNPESGPTVIQHLQLMLNERGGFPIVNVDGDFGPSTDQSVKHYQQNENLTSTGLSENRLGHPSCPNGCCSRHQVEWVASGRARDRRRKVKVVLSGIRHTIGAAAVRKKAATSDIVLGMVGGKGTSLRELRDRAILLLGFSGAFRRSELVALNLDDIEWTT
jgi:peptidoglycan hydrolase-like protein with peptidoglycan-binding domain